MWPLSKMPKQTTYFAHIGSRRALCPVLLHDLLDANN